MIWLVDEAASVGLNDGTSDGLKSEVKRHYIMIDVHYWPTPNGKKVTVQLEECGIDCNVVYCSIGTGSQFEKDFLDISPNNRMPAIVYQQPHR
jgi:hypothetical protein